MEQYEALFGGSELDKHLDKLIQVKVAQGLDESAILDELTGGKPFD